MRSLLSFMVCVTMFMQTALIFGQTGSITGGLNQDGIRVGEVDTFNVMGVTVDISIDPAQVLGNDGHFRLDICQKQKIGMDEGGFPIWGDDIVLASDQFGHYFWGAYTPPPKMNPNFPDPVTFGNPQIHDGIGCAPNGYSYRPIYRLYSVRWEREFGDHGPYIWKSTLLDMEQGLWNVEEEEEDPPGGPIGSG